MQSPIERVGDIPIEQFRERYLEPGIPVIIEGLVSKWPAAKKWSPTYLAEKVGDKTVPVVTMYDGDYANSELNEILLKEYLELTGAVSENQNTGDNRDPKATRYLAEVSIGKHLPELLSDLEVPSYFPKETHSSTVIYVGGTLFSQLHYHTAGSATLCLLHGKKHVRLFPPNQTRFLYPYPWYSRSSNLSRTQHKQPDPAKFPKFSNAKYCDVTVNEGEVLFIPIYWWHSIENEDMSIATVFFWKNDWASRFLPPPGMRGAYLYGRIHKLFAFSKRILVKVVRMIGIGKSDT